MIRLSAFIGAQTEMFLCKTRGPGSLELSESPIGGTEWDTRGGLWNGCGLSGVEEDDTRSGGCDIANGGKLNRGM